MGFTEDPHNIEFCELIDELTSFGRTQQEVAAILGISPGQLTRVKKGERHATRRHIRALRGELRRLNRDRDGEQRKRPAGGPVKSIFALSGSNLAELSPAQATEAFRDLLSARAFERRVPTTRISISLGICSADGGIDASVLDGVGPAIDEDDLTTAHTRFQIKTGRFSPRQKSEIDRELFGSKKSATFVHLGTAVQRTLREAGRYVLVCFGIDPADEDLRIARETIRDAFKLCGYSDVKVEVWGQNQLIGLLQHYPSLCIRMSGHDQQGFRSRPSWSSDDDMQPAVHYSPEQQQLIEELRGQLRSGEAAHLRLIGEPGVGKTRLALELTAADDLAPATLYVPDARSLLGSTFINSLIEADDTRFVLLVVDECPNNDRAELWNQLKSRTDRVRLITIDHGPDDSVDSKVRVERVSRVQVEQIIEILRDHGVGEYDAKRWAEYCEGCPRVAHVLGENLRLDRPDLLQGPAAVEVWDRFVVGYDRPDSEDVRLRGVVLRHISLFERFGFEPPVQDEAKFIAGLAQKCDPSLTWPRFQSIVATLRRRRILQGGRTLYVTPRLLQVHLFREFWDAYGTGFEIAEALSEMPPQLWNWFVQMLRYAHGVPQAEKAIERLLDGGKLFPPDCFPDTEQAGRVIEVLAETSRKAVVRCLRRTIGSMGTVKLRELKRARQLIVWALGKIAVWEDSFCEAAELLLQLAEAENANQSNNATGTFKELFTLSPGMAATQASPSIRLSVLERALDFSVADRRRLGLAACEAALSTLTSFRVVSAEYQGLRKTIEFWWPKTYGELWDAYRNVWNLLVSKLDTWTGADRELLIKAIIRAAWSILYIQPLAETVVATLKSLVNDPATDIGALVELTKRQLRHGGSDLPPTVKDELRTLCESLDGCDFPSRLRRFIKFTTPEDYHDEALNPTRFVMQNVEALAVQGFSDRDSLMRELPWLVRKIQAPRTILPAA